MNRYTCTVSVGGPAQEDEVASEMSSLFSLPPSREICQLGGFDPEKPTGLPLNLSYESTLALVSWCMTI